MKFNLVIFISVLIILFGCNNTNQNLPLKESRSDLDLVKNLEKYYETGDSINYERYRSKIDNIIIKNNDVKLKSYLLLFDGKRAFTAGKFDLSLNILHALLEDCEQNKLVEIKLATLHYIGNIYFYKNDLNNSLKYWKEANSLIISEKIQNGVGEIYTNLGIAYLQLGYSKTAIDYFTKAKAHFDNNKVKSENYYINDLNIVAATLNLNQFDEAQKILDNIDIDCSKTVSYFYYINKSKIFSLKNDYKNFNICIDSAEFFLKFYPAYKSMYNEILVENYLKFNKVDKLKEFLNKSKYPLSERSIYLTLLEEEANLILKQNPVISIDSLLKIGYFLQAEKDLNSLSQYYKVIILYYEKTGNIKSENQALKLKDLNQLKLNDEKLKTQYFDYKEYTENKNLTFKNQLLVSEVQTKNEKIKSQRLISLLIILLSILIILVTTSIILSKQKRNKLKERELKIAKLELIELERNRENLEKEKRIQELKLKKTSELLLKTSSIRNQFNEIFKLINNNDDWSQIRLLMKKMKISLNEIFLSYDEFIIKSMLNDNILEKVALIETKLPELNKDEVQLVALISSNYTTKEISNLLSRSEKHVEAKRTLLRKKLNIGQTDSLKDFINLRLNK